ncbi:Uncharacterised protein [Vibrio cholerae]|nr:Uncharacterised protein [Vibrio cholerae]
MNGILVWVFAFFGNFVRDVVDNNNSVENH